MADKNEPSRAGNGTGSAAEPPAPSVEDFGGASLPGGREGIVFRGWRVEAVKRPILTGPEEERWQKDLGAFRLPEMVFGHSRLELEHIASGTVISFNALDALKEWNSAKLPPVKIPAAAAWAARKRPSQELILDYDYTFTTPYKGTLSRRPIAGACSSLEEPNPGTCRQSIEAEEEQTMSVEWQPRDDAEIDWDLLKRRDPILFFDEVILYEDELADSGVALLSARARVMPSCWFVLLRFWLRVDGSLMRAYETRMFCPFGTLDEDNQRTGSHVPLGPMTTIGVVREYCEREASFAALAAKGYPSESAEYKQPDAAVQRLTVQKAERALLEIHKEAE